jgi:hypothetical protein
MEEKLRTEMTSRRRERKPRKAQICHIRPDLDDGPSGDGRPVPELSITRRGSPCLPRPLDLSLPRPPAPPAPRPAPRPAPGLALVLRPSDYEALAPLHPLYASYIFLPSVGVFAHPLAIPPSLAPSPALPPASRGEGPAATGADAAFCTFKNIQTVPARRASPHGDPETK